MTDHAPGPDAGFRQAAPRRRILYVQYANPAAYPPLEHSSRILADAGWQVLILGVTSGQGVGALQFPPHTNITSRALGWVARGWRQKLHYLRFALWALGWVLRWRPRWVYVSDLLACPAAWLIRWLPGVRVVYHEHDSPDPQTAQSLMLRIAFRARRAVAHHAAFCILPNAQRGQVFAQQTGTPRPVLTVWNCPRREELAQLTAVPHAERGSTDAARLRVYYHGTLVPIRVPHSLVHALALLDQPAALTLVGYETVGAPGYSAGLRALAAQVGVADRVTINANGLPRADAMALCATQDVGLALTTQQAQQDVNHRYFVGASNKAFDYLACGLALLVPDLPEWRTAFVEPGYALACDPDDAASIAAALRWFIEHPQERVAMVARGRARLLDDWNYEHQFAPVLARLEHPDRSP